MTGVQKRFGATQALRNVFLEVAPGEVHALIGENGAGKSTLMKILSGAYKPDAGSIELDGAPFVPANPHHARQCGIAMIYQELTLAPHLSVAENILLGCEPSRRGWLNRKRRREMARVALATLGHENISCDKPVHRLSIAEQQIVEIARVLIGQPKVLIMDEPTSSLAQTDAERLFAIIERLSKRGVSVVYISHFLEECKRVCARYTVLRDGETVGNGDMQTAEITDIIRLMVGREVDEIYTRVPHEIGDPVLELRHVAGRTKPRDVDLVLRKGEVLGIAGLIGAGRTETLRALFGLDPICNGTVLLFSWDRTHGTPSDRLQQGVGLLSENRKEEGLMLDRSVADNLTSTRYAPFSRLGFVNGFRQRRCVSDWIRRLDIRTRRATQRVAELSGGNQQKVALGRLLHHDAAVLLLDEPTRGIDVGSKAQIYKLIGELAAEGKAIVFVSSYLPELLGICDRIAVMCRGQITAIRPAPEWTEDGIIAAAIGQGATSPS
ncbi:MAG: sugar ABC transporter ATP-binding protein [Phycisphaerales bacterium]|nr:sugar ABC transporter ATP-binding protein [Phycisphaerales bacterium]